jgi:hypothetical protein
VLKMRRTSGKEKEDLNREDVDIDTWKRGER